MVRASLMMMCAQGTRVNNIFKRRVPMPRVQGDECVCYLRGSLARNTRQNSPTHPSERSLILSRRELIRSAGEPRPIHSWAARNHHWEKNTHSTQYVRWTGLARQNSQTPFHEVLFVCGIPACENSWSGSNLVAQPSMANLKPSPARPHLHVANSHFAPLRFRRSRWSAYYRRHSPASSSFTLIVCAWARQTAK